MKKYGWSLENYRTYMCLAVVWVVFFFFFAECMGCSFNLQYKFIGSFCTSRQNASPSSNLPQ